MEERERGGEEEMEQEKKEGETNVCLSDDVDVDMTNSDSSSAWILTESIHARTLMCTLFGSQEKEADSARVFRVM